MTTGAFTAPSSSTAIAGSALNALPVGNYAWGPELDNSTNRQLYATLELGLASAVTAGAGGFLSFFIVYPDSAGNYPASSGNPGLDCWVRNFTPPASSFQFTGELWVPVAIQPGKLKVVVLNNFGNAFPASTASFCNIRLFADSFQ